MAPPGLLPVDYIGREPTLLSGVLPSGVPIKSDSIVRCLLSWPSTIAANS